MANTAAAGHAVGHAAGGDGDGDGERKPEVHPLPPSVLQIMGKALWDPKPTQTELHERQLAYAMGYPDGWRVERRIETSREGRPLILDTIHAVSRNKSKCVWFHHHEAQKAASAMLEQGDAVLQFSKSHLLPPVPKYAKGDAVQVKINGKLCTMIIQKRRKRADSFIYSAKAEKGSAVRDGLREDDMQPPDDPFELAAEMSFPEGWQAHRKGSRYAFITPDGKHLPSKKAAQEYIKQHRLKPPKTPKKDSALQAMDMGDPPWRLEGHELIGRRVLWGHDHKVTSRRTVTVQQYGTVLGYIAATDLDSDGNPGFVSELSGQPANLFYVHFPDDPTHPYQQHLIASQDLEEFEVQNWLLPESKKDKKPKTPTKASLQSSSSSLPEKATGTAAATEEAQQPTAPTTPKRPASTTPTSSPSKKRRR